MGEVADPEYDADAELEWEAAQPIDRAAVERAKARRQAYRDNRLRQHDRRTTMVESCRAALERVTNAWRVGPYVFSEIEGHGFASIPGPVYRFEIDGRPASHEVYETLDMALASAVGERWTGPRGAGGSGVDTAAGWFLRMIGAIGVEAFPGESIELVNGNGSEMRQDYPATARRVLS